jgi:hypothetical protein
MLSNFGTALLSCVVSLVLASLFSGSIIHESAHAIMAIVFGLKVYSWTLTYVTFETSSNLSVKTVIGLAGGTAQALSSLFLLWIILRIENSDIQKLLNRWHFLGIKSGFLAIAFVGILTAFWEGFFLESYVQSLNNLGGLFLWRIIGILCLVTAFYFFLKQKPFKNFG